ncbi:MAG: hypothetical protein ACXVZL_06230 [Gaiellaceae bacterium]
MVADDLSLLLEEIEQLLHEPPRGGLDAVARVEETLTDGYARALALEAERWRTERRIAEVAKLVAEGSTAGVAELSTLSGRLEQADADLRRLRERLGSLRRHAEAVRAA